MNVPFSSSGALSRRHYGLVRAAESSASVQEANNVLRAEMEAVQVDMARADLTLVNALSVHFWPLLTFLQVKCMECLVVLLYCFNAIELFSPGSIAFAFPHAVNLAEAGKTVEQKRIGKFVLVKTQPTLDRIITRLCLLC